MHEEPPRPRPGSLIAYLIAGDLLHRGPARTVEPGVEAQRGNRAGMIGMTIAVVTTLSHPTHNRPQIAEDRPLPIVIGGGARPARCPPASR